MSYPHNITLTLGHLDEQSVRKKKVLVLKPLDMTAVTRLLSEIGEVDQSGRATLGGHAVSLEDGYVICPWYVPPHIPATEIFARRLQAETGCVIANFSTGYLVDLDKSAELSRLSDQWIAEGLSLEEMLSRIRHHCQ